MNHAEAVSNGAVERYLQGQLSPSESDQFEQHFFDCLECARELRVGAMFEDNARAVFVEERSLAEAAGARTRRPAEAKPSIWAWVWQRPWGVVAPAAAAIALAALTAYQVWVVIPGLRGQLQEALAPQPVVSYVLPPLSRGDARVLEVPGFGRFYTIYMDPTWDPSFAAYLCSIQDESGSTKFSLRVPAPPPGKPIQILMARTRLPSGRYTVVIRGAAESGKPETELGRYALILKID
jgi:hypothetical protein